MVKNIFTFLSDNKEHDIHAVCWLPDNLADVKAVLQISHGMSEYAERYEDFAKYMVGYGFAVFANDHAGHGKSLNAHGDLGYFGGIKGREHLIKDMYMLTTIAKRQFSRKPFFLLGHSMGSFLSRKYAIEYSNELTAAAYLGTAGKHPLLNMAIAMTTIGKFFRHKKFPGKFIDAIVFGGFDRKIKHPESEFDWISANRANVENFLKDEKTGFFFTISAFHELFLLMKEVNVDKWFAEMPKKLPVLLAAGTDDPVGRYGKGVEEVAQRLHNADVKDITLKLYPGMRHEILNELENEQVYRFVRRWMERYV